MNVLTTLILLAFFALLAVQLIQGAMELEKDTEKPKRGIDWKEPPVQVCMNDVPLPETCWQKEAGYCSCTQQKERG